MGEMAYRLAGRRLRSCSRQPRKHIAPGADTIREVRVRAAECVVDQASKAMENEDVEARLEALERIAAAAKEK
jgi:hypothetical protein